MSMSDGGKGSKPRPRVISNEEYESRWDVIFGKDKPTEAELLTEELKEETTTVKPS